MPDSRFTARFYCSVARSIAEDFAAEITPVVVKGRKGEVTVDRVETPFTCDVEKIPTLKPAFNKDGTMAVDDGKLTKAISNNLAGVTAMFSGTGDTTSLGKQVTDFVDSLSTTNGALKVAQDGITNTLKDLEDDYTRVEDRVNSTIERYKTQFTQLDMLVAQMNRTSSYLTQQFDALKAQTSK